MPCCLGVLTADRQAVVCAGCLGVTLLRGWAGCMCRENVVNIWLMQNLILHTKWQNCVWYALAKFLIGANCIRYDKNGSWYALAKILVYLNCIRNDKNGVWYALAKFQLKKTCIRNHKIGVSYALAKIPLQKTCIRTGKKIISYANRER